MRITEMLIKLGGAVLFLAGLFLLLATVGLSVFGIGFSPVWLELLMGLVFIGVGIWIVRGGTITL